MFTDYIEKHIHKEYQKPSEDVDEAPTITGSINFKEFSPLAY